MHFYKLKRKFEGSVSLEEDEGSLEPSKGGAAAALNKKKDSLQQLIDRFNEEWSSDFAGGDHAVISMLRQEWSSFLR
mgnify:CR=1 FL=1